MTYEEAVTTGAAALRDETFRVKSDYTTKTGSDYEPLEAVARAVLDAVGYQQTQEAQDHLRNYVGILTQELDRATAMADQLAEALEDVRRADRSQRQEKARAAYDSWKKGT